MTKLQVAVDLLTTADALALTNKVAPYVDIIELGTPLIKSAGLTPSARSRLRTRTRRSSPTSRR
jgi:3-keto-L-gulonate-6-phosphate decarboxylase